MSRGSQQWYDRCVEAVTRVHPELAGVFICPLCLNGYDSVDDVAKEHSPPDAVGGRVVALTCRTCNSTAGHTLDTHMRRFEDMVDFGRGTLAKPLRIRFEAGGATVNAALTRADGTVRIIGHPPSTDPREHAAQSAYFERLVATGGGDGERFNVAFRDPVALPNVRAGWLRAAYIVAFAKFGYRYILRPQLDPVRAQIAEPEADHAPRAVGANYDLEPTQERLLIVERPATLRSVVVPMGRWTAVLPGLGPELDFYGRLARRKVWPPRGTLRGKSVSWPRQPELCLDWVDLPSSGNA